MTEVVTETPNTVLGTPDPVPTPTPTETPNPTPKEGEPTPKPDDAPKPDEKKEEDKPKEGEEQSKPVEFQEAKAPEGLDFEPTSLKEYNDLAKDLKLTSEQAQKLVDWYGKHSQVAAQKQAEVWETLNNTWVSEAKADKDIGGDKFDSTVTSAKAAIKKFGNDKFVQALNTTGMGNHPEMIRFLHTVAKAFGEDKLVTGVPGGTPLAKSAAQILFPSMPN